MIILAHVVCTSKNQRLGIEYNIYVLGILDFHFQGTMSGKCCCKFKRLNSGHAAHPHYDSGYAISCKLVELSTTVRFSGANGTFVEISIGSSLRHVGSFPHDLD
jgi:hypothetical protein